MENKPNHPSAGKQFDESVKHQRENRELLEKAMGRVLDGFKDKMPNAIRVSPNLYLVEVMFSTAAEVKTAERLRSEIEAALKEEAKKAGLSVMDASRVTVHFYSDSD